jgi:poly(hydroxyalkanoate) depolymerase family esterase
MSNFLNRALAPEVLSCARSISRDLLSRRERSAGTWVDGWYSGKSGARPYRLYVPRESRGQAPPLVVMLHGCGQEPGDFAAGTRMHELAEHLPFLVVYPEQVRSANRRKCWNWFRPAHQERGRGEPALVAGITREVINAYHVDQTRVYVAGMSAGGAMAAVLGATYPDMYAAVGVHSGLAYKAGQSPFSAWRAMKSGGPNPRRRVPLAFLDPSAAARVMPLIVFHGDEDETANAANADQLLDQWAWSNDLADDGVENGTISDRPALALDAQAPNGHAYTRFVYHAGRQIIMEKWIVHGMGHAWSGGSPDGSHTDPRGPSASEQMLRFFRQHRMASPRRPLVQARAVAQPFRH